MTPEDLEESIDNFFNSVQEYIEDLTNPKDALKVVKIMEQNNLEIDDYGYYMSEILSKDIKIAEKAIDYLYQQSWVIGSFLNEKTIDLIIGLMTYFYEYSKKNTRKIKKNDASPS